MPTRWWSSPSRSVATPCCLIFGLQACGSCSLDEETEIRCGVEMGGDPTVLHHGSPPALETLGRAGPHPVWSTQPHPSCSHNPMMPAASSEAELELLVTYPAARDPVSSGFGDVAPGSWPVILFGHANSYQECRALDAYPSLHEHWASWGYIVLSVDASSLCVKNSQANLEGRRDDLLTAWAALKSMAADPESPFHERVDEESLILAGHSRGASGALLVSASQPEVDGLIWLQGVDTAGYHLGHPRVPVPALGIVAGSDRDIKFPKAEPTEDQLGPGHSWVRLDGGIHAFTSDTLPPKELDSPSLTRAEQLELSAHLSTLLLAATVGVSDGAAPVHLPSAAELLFGPDVLGIHPAIEATWERPSTETLWVADFQRSEEINLTGGSVRIEPPRSAQRRLAWSPEGKSGGRILGDSFAMQLQNGRLSLGLGDSDLTIPAGTLLVFRLKDRASGDLLVHFDTVNGRISHPAPSADPDVDPQYYQQVEIALNEPLEQVSMLTLELNPGTAMIDDLRLVFP